MDVVALGELLIDFTENGVSGQGNPLFEANPGGAPCNVLAMLSRLGHRTAFIGKVGNDHYGDFFRENLRKNNIEDKVLVSELLPSGVASTFISPDGERTFGTYLGAAASLKAEELSLDMFKGYAYLFIEGYLVQDHEMILHAIELAKEAGLQRDRRN